MAVRTVVKSTCPRDCYDSCGMSVMVDDGRIRSVAGDAAHFVSRGKLCAKCSLAYNGAWIDPAQRLLRPLRRTGPKGLGQFEAVSWDTALDGIAAGLRSAIDQAGGASVLHTHYTGTCSVLARTFPLRFFHRLGATEVDPDTVCNKAGHEGLRYILGDSATGFDPRSAAGAACIVVWGANPSAAAPHAHRDWLAEAPGLKIVIDPVRHATAAAADIFLQPRPGTDAALAFAMLRAARDAGLLDRAFLDAHTLGWDEIAPAVEAVTVERGEALTGVPALLIRRAGEVYAAGPSLLWLGQGLQRQRMGGNAFRAAAMLAAATGNIGKPGAGLLFLNGGAARGLDHDELSGAALGSMPSISHMDLSRSLQDPSRFRALVTWNNNIVASSPDQRRLRAALQREDLLHVAIDLFQTDTCDYADYVLPAASFLEFDDIVIPYFHLAVSAQVKAIAPLGESLPNQEVFRRLARHMGFSEPALHESDDAVIARVLEQTGAAASFAALAEAGTVMPFREPVVPFADKVFPTPSGKIEFASSVAEAEGQPRVPVPHADADAPSGRLRLLSPASEWTMNSSYANDSKIERQLGPAQVWVHPDDAGGLPEGAAVILSNITGRLPVALRRSDCVQRGVAIVHKGRWPKCDPAGANVNVLNPGDKTDMGESSCVHGVEVSLSPA